MVVDNAKNIEKLRVKMSSYVAAEFVQLKEIKSELELERVNNIPPRSRRNLSRLYRYERRLAKFKLDLFRELEAAVPFLHLEVQGQIEDIMLAVIQERIKSETKFLDAIKRVNGLGL